MTIGMRVHELLEAQSKKQRDLANYLHVGESTVSQWKDGKKNPKTDYILPLSEFFGVSVNFILSGKEAAIPTLSETDQEILKWLHLLNEETQRDFLGQIRLYVKQHKEDWATTDNEDAPEKEEVAAASK